MTKAILRRIERRPAVRKVQTVCVSLEPIFVRLLDDLAKEKGSKSAVIRDLLLDHSYREYYSDPRNVEADRKLTLEMMSIASWPQEPYYDEPRRRTKKRPAR
jgi:hypothetical protein